MGGNRRKRCQARSILKWKGGEGGGGPYCAGDSVSSLVRVKAPSFSIFYPFLSLSLSLSLCVSLFLPFPFFSGAFSFPRFPPFRCRWLALAVVLVAFRLSLSSLRVLRVLRVPVASRFRSFSTSAREKSKQRQRTARFTVFNIAREYASVISFEMNSRSRNIRSNNRRPRHLRSSVQGRVTSRVGRDSSLPRER